MIRLSHHALSALLSLSFVIASPSLSHAQGFGDVIQENLEGEDLASLTQRSITNDSYSRSPLGFSTFYAFAEDLGYPVDRLQSTVHAGLGENYAVVLLEPVLHYTSTRAYGRVFDDYLSNAATIILVVPKRIPLQSNPLGTELTQTGLVRLSDLSEVSRAAYWLTQFHRDDYQAEAFASLDVDDLQTMEVLQTPDPPFEVILGDESRGVIFDGESRAGQRMIVVTDPDLLSNHGILRGENAAAAQTLLELLPAGTRLYFDEALHGYARQYSLWAALMGFPTILITFAFALFALLWLWRSRFRHASEARVEEADHAHLAALRRSASVIAHVIPAKRSVQRLRDAFVRDALSRGGLRRLNEDEAIARLETLRHPSKSIRDLDARLSKRDHLNSSAARRLANQYQAWYREVTHGS